MGNEFPGREVHAGCGWAADLDCSPHGCRRSAPDAHELEVAARLVGRTPKGSKKYGRDDAHRRDWSRNTFLYWSEDDVRLECGYYRCIHSDVGRPLFLGLLEGAAFPRQCLGHPAVLCGSRCHYLSGFTGYPLRALFELGRFIYPARSAQLVIVIPSIAGWHWPIVRQPRATASSYIAGTFILVPLCLIEAPFSAGFDFSPLVLIALGFLSVLSPMTNFLYYQALTRVSPHRAAVFMNLIPIIVMISSAIFLGEQITRVQIMGTACVIGGVVLTTKQ